MLAVFEHVGALDRACLAGIAARRAPPWLDRTFRVTTHLGGVACTILLPLVLLLFASTRALGETIALANMVSHLAVQCLKRSVIRQRPNLTHESLAALVAIPDAFSFPSGHACAAMAVALPLFLADTPFGMPALALALLVGASRVYLRVHYITDVVVGQLLGAGAAIGAMAWVN